MLKSENIKVDKISQAPLFETSFNRDERPLQSSIQVHGIVSPPHLFQSADSLQVLDGMMRIKIAQQIGMDTITCFIHDAKNLEQNDAFMLCLELNRWCRTFNLVERALCIKTATQLFGGLKIPKSFWNMIDIKPNVRTIYQHKELLKLSPSIQKFAISNNIALSVILGFLRFPEDERDKIASQLFILPVNQNKLAEILITLNDIAKKEEITPSQILDETLLAIKSEKHPVTKEQLLRRTLQKRRNPHYEKYLTEFEHKLKALPIKTDIKITPPPFFEDSYVELNARLQSKEDITQLIEVLNNKVWSELIQES